MKVPNPIVMWKPETGSENSVKVLNPEIPLAKYTFLYDPENFNAIATTPSMTLSSLSINGQFYKEELEALQSWYSDSKVMEKYGPGTTRSAEQTEARYKQLSERWTYGLPYSGLMARNADGKLVAMFNLGYAVDDDNKPKPGVTEFAGVVDPSEWNNGLASEALILLLVGIKYLNDAGYQIEDAPLKEVVTAAREDNTWANKALENSALTFKYKKEIDGATRNVYGASVTELLELLHNTERAHVEPGAYVETSSPKPQVA